MAVHVVSHQDSIYRVDERVYSEPEPLGKWTPSIHMPKYFTRIWLEVTGVKCQRVIDITEDEACQDGFESLAEFRSTWTSISKRMRFV